MRSLIVADAGPLIALGRIDALALLSEVATRVLVPTVVEAECLHDRTKPGIAPIETAFAEGLLQPQPESPNVSSTPLPGLGLGESVAIELAEMLGLPLLIDERLGRRIATQRGVRVIGTLAVLVLARRRGRIAALSPVLSQLAENGYFVSEALIDSALRSVGERERRGPN